MNRVFSRTEGFALVEVMVAAAIIGVSMLGLGVGIKKVSQSRDLVRGVSTALAFESALQAAMIDPAQYSDIKDELAKTTKTVPDFTLRVRVTNQNGNEETVNLPINHNVTFNADGEPCQNCNDWIFRARVEGALKGSTTVVPVYAMAYRLEFNPSVLNLAPLGAPGAQAFAADDFKWMVPIEAYLNPGLQDCKIGDRDVIVTGINRETMQVNCLKVGDSSQCAPDEIATGWVYETSKANSSPLRQLKMGCRKLATFPTCPSLGPGGFEYVMNGFDPRTATTSSPTDKCVFIAKSTADVTMNVGGTGTARSAVFDVCPPHYEFKPDSGTENGCQASVQKTFLGWRDAGCPAGYSGACWVQDVSPEALKVKGKIQNSGRQVACDLENDQQILTGPNNWAGFEAKISVKGKCVLGSPEML